MRGGEPRAAWGWAPTRRAGGGRSGRGAATAALAAVPRHPASCRRRRSASRLWARSSPVTEAARPARLPWPPSPVRQSLPRMSDLEGHPRGRHPLSPPAGRARASTQPPAGTAGLRRTHLWGRSGAAAAVPGATLAAQLSGGGGHTPDAPAALRAVG